MVEVQLDDNKELERKLREFRRMMIRSGKFKEMREKRHYLKPSDKKKAKRKAAMKRRHRERKAARRNAWP